MSKHIGPRDALGTMRFARVKAGVARAFAMLALMVWSAASWSQTPDIETQCLDCHRPSQTRGEVPVVEGQQQEYLRNQLRRFKQRHRESFPMSNLTSGFDDAAIDSMSEALAQRAWRAPEVRPAVMSESVARGESRVRARACDTCHGARFLGSGDIPRLAGQHPGYIARQIESFARGDRYHPPSGTGAPMRTIGADERADIAAFLHQLVALDARPE